MPTDVGSVLGISGNDLSAVCQAASINKFARYKPVPHSSAVPLTDAQRRSVNHGIVIPDVVTGSALTGALVEDAAGNDWDYTPPTGGASQIFRLDDFGKPGSTTIGYNHYAVPPIQCVYPRDGWTFMRGTTSRSLVIYFDLDPADDADNLQATDFTDGTLDLNEWKFVVYIDGIGLFTGDDFILDSGVIAGNTVACIIPAGTGSYNRNVYVAMYRVNNNRYELLPLPKQDYYNPTLMKLKVVDDAQASGGGLGGDDTEEMFNNVGFSYALNGTYKTAWDATDNGTAKWSLGTSGDLYISMNLTNKSGASKTINRSDFTLDLNGNTPSLTPTTLYNAQKSAVTSVTIANNATVTVYMYFQNIFGQINPASDWSSSNINSSWSMDMARSGATIFGGDIYAHKNSNQGWYQR